VIDNAIAGLFEKSVFFAMHPLGLGDCEVIESKLMEHAMNDIQGQFRSRRMPAEKGLSLGQFGVCDNRKTAPGFRGIGQIETDTSVTAELAKKRRLTRRMPGLSVIARSMEARRMRNRRQTSRTNSRIRAGAKGTQSVVRSMDTPMASSVRDMAIRPS
jgi:hypothetical protein